MGVSSQTLNTSTSCLHRAGANHLEEPLTTNGLDMLIAELSALNDLWCNTPSASGVNTMYCTRVPFIYFTCTAAVLLYFCSCRVWCLIAQRHCTTVQGATRINQKQQSRPIGLLSSISADSFSILFPVQRLEGIYIYSPANLTLPLLSATF